MTALTKIMRLIDIYAYDNAAKKTPKAEGDYKTNPLTMTVTIGIRNRNYDHF